MDEQLIFYIDLLGFSEAVNDEGRIEGLIDLLNTFAAQRGPFKLKEEWIDESARSFEMYPEISTFSDHIVFSFPVEPLRRISGQDYLSFPLTMATGMIGTLATEALRLDMLIRGGATIGPLHHRDGVVMGKALVEAFGLESRVANYPRVVVSRKVYSQAADYPFPVSDDGITHLNYFQNLVLSQPDRGSWFATMLGKAAENVQRFEAAEKWNEMSKWSWFASAIKEERSNLPDSLFAPSTEQEWHSLD